MEILVILAHPNIGSFNHAIAKTCVETLKTNGHEVIYHDLYEEGFNPVLQHEEIPKNAELDPVIKKYCTELARVGGIIIVHKLVGSTSCYIERNGLTESFAPELLMNLKREIVVKAFLSDC